VKLIQTTTLGASALNITFTSIPQGYTDLVAVISGRTDRAAVDDAIIIRFNSDNTSGNYAGRRLWGLANAENADGVYSILGFSGATATTNTFGSEQVFFPDYTSARVKSFFAEGGGIGLNTSQPFGIVGARWTGTAAITSIAFTSSTGSNIVAGSTISLYGITKSSDAITIAS